MKNYTLLRFVKLNLYFLVMYSFLTALWYGFSGRFSEPSIATALQEILFNAAIFSLFFSIAILLWYRRTSVRIPLAKYKQKELQQRLEELGYLQVVGLKQQKLQVYKPTPPKAPALAGKVFVQQTASFYLVEGPTKFIKNL